YASDCTTGFEVKTYQASLSDGVSFYILLP
ncbi:MAG: hypothetical protein QOD60_552, partial [Solirubrobacterales bacterium]|nr:hypothetical protein [Solirubrobacterales bacterium]